MRFKRVIKAAQIRRSLREHNENNARAWLLCDPKTITQPLKNMVAQAEFDTPLPMKDDEALAACISYETAIITVSGVP